MAAGRHLRLGAQGEQRAASWYAARGYVVVARNWRCPDGELDRTSDRFGLPAEAVTPAKQRRLRRLAVRFLAEAGGAGGRSLRFDVASVVGERVEVIEAAF